LPIDGPSAGRGLGGALFVETNADAVAEETAFTGNSALGATGGSVVEPGAALGAAVFAGGSVQLRSCTLERNVAQGGSSHPPGPARGGAVASLGGLQLNACTLNDNTA